MTSPFWTIKEASEYLRCDDQTLRLAIKRDQLKCARIGWKIMFRQEWLDKWVEQNARKFA